jgi:non-ribosomal peptide synthetase component F
MKGNFPHTVFQKNTLAGPEIEGSCVLSFSFGEAVDRARWKAAWAAVAKRHPILTCSEAVSGDLLCDWEEPDWSGVDPAALGERWSAFLAEKRSSEISPENPPFWKVALLQLPGGFSHFVFSYHPALLDSESVVLLLRESLAVYDAFAPGEIPHLPVAKSYEEALSALEGLEENPLAYWSQFRDLPAIESPVSCLLRDGLGNDPNEECEIVYSPDPGVVTKLEQVAAAHHTDLRVALGAVWNMVLSRMDSRSRAVVAWLTSARRALPESVSDVCGLFEGYLPVVTTEPDGTSAAAWIASVADEVWASESVLLTDLTDLASISSHKRALAFPEAAFRYRFPTLSDLLHTALPRWIASDAQLFEIRPRPLTLTATGGKRPGFRLEYDPTMVRKADALRILQRYIHVLHRLADHPDEPFVLPDAKAALVAPIGIEAEKPVAALASACQRFSDSFAATYGNDSMSFRDVDVYSNQLARYLRKLRNGSNGDLAVCLSPTPWLQVALLAAVKLGGRCHLFDAGLSIPSGEGLEGCSVVVADAATEALFAESKARVVAIDQSWDKISEQPETPPAGDTQPCSFVFPKDDKESHQAAMELALLVDSARRLASWQNLGEGSRLLVTSAPGLVLAEQSLAGLLSGACLIFPEDDIQATRSAFQNAISELEISHIAIPAVWWSQWVHYLFELQQYVPACLLRVVVYGDSWPSKGAMEAWSSRSTETTSLDFVWSPEGLLASGFAEPFSGANLHSSEGMISLGDVVPGIGADVRDFRKRPLPPGSRGEITLSRGGLLPKNDLFDASPVADSGVISTGRFGFFHDSEESRVAYLAEGLAPGISWQQSAVLRKTVAGFSGVFDFLLRASQESEGTVIEIWIVPTVSDSGLPKGLNEVLRRLSMMLGCSWRVAWLPRIPVGRHGVPDFDALPPTTPLDLLTDRIPQGTEPVVPAVSSITNPPSSSAAWRVEALHSGDKGPCLFVLGEAMDSDLSGVLADLLPAGAALFKLTAPQEGESSIPPDGNKLAEAVARAAASREVVLIGIGAMAPLVLSMARSINFRSPMVLVHPDWEGLSWPLPQISSNESGWKKVFSFFGRRKDLRDNATNRNDSSDTYPPVLLLAEEDIATPLDEKFPQREFSSVQRTDESGIAARIVKAVFAE